METFYDLFRYSYGQIFQGEHFVIQEISWQLFLLRYKATQYMCFTLVLTTAFYTDDEHHRYVYSLS